jgi:hypothetical protein
MSTDLQGLVTADDEFDDLPEPAARQAPPSRPTRLHSVANAAAPAGVPAHDPATGEVIEGEHRIVSDGPGGATDDPLAADVF